MEGWLPVCPKCGGRSTTKHLRKRGVCAPCLDFRQYESVELTGAEKDRALDEFAEWLKTTKGPWERATSGLRMFVRDDGRAFWP